TWNLPSMASGPTHCASKSRPRVEGPSSRSSSASRTPPRPASMRGWAAGARSCSSALCSAGSSTSCATPRQRNRLDNLNANERKDTAPRRRSPPRRNLMKLSALALALALGALIVSAPRSQAADKDESWVLDANNWQEGKDLLPEPVLKRLQKGEYWFKVVPTDREKFHKNYSQAFWDATAANEGKYDLEPKQCGLRDKASGKIPEFVFGLPFPKIDKADAQAGCKVAWNFNLAGAMGGGGGATFTLNGVDTGGQFR